jgi:serine phosphatase RsbU (regulator of sigma subunit)
VRLQRELVPAKRAIKALEAHVDTLKAQLGAAETRANSLAVDFATREARLTADLRVERSLFDKMSVRVDQLTSELAAEHARRARAEQELVDELARRWWNPRTR